MEMKIISEIKKKYTGWNYHQVDVAEEKIHDVEGITIETIQNEIGKNVNEKSIFELSNIIQQPPVA